MTHAFSDVLLVGGRPNQWVKYVNNDGNAAHVYVSTAVTTFQTATTGAGVYTFNPSPIGGIYTSYLIDGSLSATAPAAADIRWAATGITSHVVAYTAGDDAALDSVTASTGPNTNDAEATANNGIVTPWFNREFWLPNPSGTDDTAAIVAADTAAALVNGIVRFRTSTTNYKYSSQITKTTRWVGGGRQGTTLQCTVALGLGVRSILDNYQLGVNDAALAHTPSIDGIAFIGPGTLPVPTNPTKTASVDGIQINNKLFYRDTSAEYFDSGLVFHSPLGHITLKNVVSTNNYYGIYQELSNGDHYLEDCTIDGNGFANVAFPGTVQMDSWTVIRTHIGHAPYGVYQETGSTVGFVNDCTFVDARFEAIGNSAFLVEDFATASVGGFSGTTIINPGFSFNNTYKITARAQDWAIKVGTCSSKSNLIIMGGSPFSAGTGGVIFVNTNQIEWQIFGDQGGTFTLTGHQEMLHRWPRNSSPLLGTTIFTGIMAATVFALTDGPTVSVNAQNGGYFTLSAGGSRTIANPTNLISGAPLSFDVLNNTVGAITTTWGTGTFKLAGAWVDPAAGKRRTITFRYDGANLIEQCRSAADI